MSKKQKHEYAGAGHQVEEFFDLEYAAMVFGIAVEHYSKVKTKWAQSNLNEMSQRLADAASEYSRASIQEESARTPEEE